MTLKLLSLNSPLASFKLCAWMCSCPHCLSRQVRRVYLLCMDMINIQFVHVNYIACVHKQLLNGKWTNSGEDPKSACSQLSRVLRYHSQTQWSFCATYLLRTALLTGAIRIFLGLYAYVCVCNYLELPCIYRLALCAFCKDESILQHKGKFSPNCSSELSNVFCTGYRTFTQTAGELTSLISVCLKEKYPNSCNY